jgi:hypothetical protein
VIGQPPMATSKPSSNLNQSAFINDILLSILMKQLKIDFSLSNEIDQKVLNNNNVDDNEFTAAVAAATNNSNNNNSSSPSK